MKEREQMWKSRKIHGVFLAQSGCKSFIKDLYMYLSTWSCQHTCFLYLCCIYWQSEPPNEDLKETIHSSHFPVKNERCVIKNSHSFFSQYFRQGRPLNQVILMVIQIEKGKIKSIARRVMSSHILGVWIPDYKQRTK